MGASKFNGSLMHSCFGLSECKSICTPILKMSEIQESGKDNKTFPYREAVGTLMYLMLGIRLDLAFSVEVLSI